jgi:hypothetical protein
LGPSVSDGDELLAFQDFTEEGIEQICQVLHTYDGESCTALDGVEDGLLCEWPSDSDDDDWDADDSFSIPGSKIFTHPLKEAVTQ